jgi:hypothetical protein
MSISKPPRLLAAIVATVLGGALLTGCSAAAEIASKGAGTAACAIIETLTQQVASDVETAISDIPVDPAAAELNLQAAKALLDTVEAQISEGTASEAATTAGVAIDGLITQAQAAQEGKPLDQKLVDQLSQELQTALSEAAGAC